MVTYIYAGLVFTSAAFASLSAETILEKADAIRNPSQSFFMRVEVSSSSDDTHEFEVHIQGHDKTLIKTVRPPRDKGRDLLMIEESMWVYIPNLKRAVRVSLSQKLTGEAANGDISRTRWQKDYDPVIKEQNAKYWILGLTARKKGLTYEKIDATIEKDTFRPVMAHYLSGTGKLLKIARFRDFKNLAGSLRPSVIEIEDAVQKGNHSKIVISQMKAQQMPDSLYTLQRFQAR